MLRKRTAGDAEIDDSQAPDAPRHPELIEEYSYRATLRILAADQNSMMSLLCPDVCTIIADYAGECARPEKRQQLMEALHDLGQCAKNAQLIESLLDCDAPLCDVFVVWHGLSRCCDVLLNELNDDICELLARALRYNTIGAKLFDFGEKNLQSVLYARVFNPFRSLRQPPLILLRTLVDPFGAPLDGRLLSGLVLAYTSRDIDVRWQAVAFLEDLTRESTPRANVILLREMFAPMLCARMQHRTYTCFPGEWVVLASFFRYDPSVFSGELIERFIRYANDRSVCSPDAISVLKVLHIASEKIEKYPETMLFFQDKRMLIWLQDRARLNLTQMSSWPTMQNLVGVSEFFAGNLMTDQFMDRIDEVLDLRRVNLYDVRRDFTAVDMVAGAVSVLSMDQCSDRFVKTVWRVVEALALGHVYAVGRQLSQLICATASLVRHGRLCDRPQAEIAKIVVDLCRLADRDSACAKARPLAAITELREFAVKHSS